MRVTSRRATTMTEHESDGFERALKLAEERKFDELLEHLRVDDPRYGCLVDTCVRDERLLPVCARAGVPALEVIELLVEHGAQVRILFQSAAHNGQVELLEAACKRLWHDCTTLPGPFHEYTAVSIRVDVLTAAAEGARATGNCGRAKLVFEWLVRSSSTHFHGIHFDPWEAYGHVITDALKDVLCGECVDTADFLLNHFVDFNLATWNFLEGAIDEIVEEGAIQSLDYLCSITRIDLHGREEFIMERVRHALEDDDVVYKNKLRHWLQKRLKGSVKEHLMNAMATLDTVKENLPEGAYLQIVRDLQGVYKGM